MKNREIKFRAFIEGEMLGADVLAFEEYGLLQDQLGSCPTLMQFTGLKDAKGVEIYEGDIVKVDNYNMYPKKAKVIQWDNELSSYVFKSDNVTPVRLPMSMGINVIGNIYQHTHLLTPQS